MEYELLRIGIALIGTAAAAWSDWRTSFIYNWITYPMAAAGIVLNLLAMVPAFSPLTALALFGVPAGLFILGYVAYRVGHVGGGDVKLLAAIALLLPATPTLFSHVQPEPYPFVIGLFIVASFLLILYVAARYMPNVAADLAARRVRLVASDVLSGVALLAACGATLWMLNIVASTPLWLDAFLAIVFAAGAFMFAFRTHVNEHYMIRSVPLGGIQEEDILAIEELPAGIVKKYGLQRLLTPDQIAKLRKTGLKRFPIYTSLPRMGPFILAALLVYVLLGPVWLPA